MLSLMPGVLLGGICACFLAPILWQLFHPLGGLIIACMLPSSLAILGLIYGIPGPKTIRLPTAMLSVFATEYLIIREALHSTSTQPLMFTALATIIGIEICMLLYSHRRLAENLTSPNVYKQVRWVNASERFWYLKKMGRSDSLRISLFTTLVTVAVVAGVLFKLHIVESSLVGSMLAICISALMADIRSITKKYHPVEIAGLRGCGYFFWHQFAAGMSWSLIVGLPLFIILFAAGGTSLGDLPINILCPLALGACAGLCTSTLIAPGIKDISSQALATIAALAIYLLPQIPLLENWSSAHIAILKIGLAGLLLAVAWMGEDHRNPFKWRRNNVAI